MQVPITLYICSLPLWYSDHSPSSGCKALARNCYCCESGPPPSWSNPCRYPRYKASLAQSFMVNGLMVVVTVHLIHRFKCTYLFPSSLFHSQRYLEMWLTTPAWPEVLATQLSPMKSATRGQRFQLSPPYVSTTFEAPSDRLRCCN